MAQISKRQLAANLPDNIRYLSKIIARKPQEYTAQWATTTDEAFSLYTRTRTVNLILSSNDILSDAGWPFPSFIDLRKETKIVGWPYHWWRVFWSLTRGGPILQGPLFNAYIGSGSAERVAAINGLMNYVFWRHQRQIFDFWLNQNLLRGKETIIREVRTTYRKNLYAACIPMILSLLDFVMRDFFKSTHLNTTLQTLRDAFDKAGILPSHLKPGYGLYQDMNSNNFVPNISNPIITNVDQDLRLPGVFLSSFVEFGSSFYSWYKTTDTSKTPKLNRHAIMHCATNYWTLANATKLLIFFDLTIRLEKVLRILIHGPNADTASADDTA